MHNRIRHLIICTINYFHRFFPRIPTETFRYAATGGFNTVLDIFLYFIFYQFILKKEMIDIGITTLSPYIAAFLIVFPITFCTGFYLAKYVTFTESTLRGRKQLFRYMISVAGSVLLNYVLLKLFVEYFMIWATVSKILTTIVVVAYSYAIQRYFTFQTGTVRRQANV